MTALAAARKAATDYLDQQNELGIQVQDLNSVPDEGPTNGGLWYRIDDVTAVFVDLARSTTLSTATMADTAARAYTYFVGSMSRIASSFDAQYIDVQGDAIFALFSGDDSVFRGIAAAITMRTEAATTIRSRLKKDARTDWEVNGRVGMDLKTVMVRKLGVGKLKNEVWAGKPVSMAAQLAATAELNSIRVSQRVFDRFNSAKWPRKRCLLYSCGCNGGSGGAGFDAEEADRTDLWNEVAVPDDSSLDFESMFDCTSAWCSTHGEEFCDTVVTGKRPE